MSNNNFKNAPLGYSYFRRLVSNIKEKALHKCSDDIFNVLEKYLNNPSNPLTHSQILYCRNLLFYIDDVEKSNLLNKLIEKHYNLLVNSKMNTINNISPSQPNNGNFPQQNNVILPRPNNVNFPQQNNVIVPRPNNVMLPPQSNMPIPFQNNNDLSPEGNIDNSMLSLHFDQDNSSLGIDDD